MTPYSPLALAYIGDAVYEMLVRTHVLQEGNMQAAKLHKKGAAITCAKAQSAAYHKLEGKLTQAELGVLKRGRNARSASQTKSASAIEYRRATGLEALFGYLYLSGDTPRIQELFCYIITSPTEEEHGV